MRYYIETNKRSRGFDVRAKNLIKDVVSIGISGLEKVSEIRCYTLTGDISPEQARYICSELLSDPISESFRINRRLSAKGAFSIDVRFREGITDPLARSILKGISDLGITAEISVETSMRYILEGGISGTDVSLIADKLIVNGLLHVYSIWMM